MLDEKDIQIISQLLAQQKNEIKSELISEMDARFAQQKAEIDARFAQQDEKIDALFAQQKAEIDTRFAQQDEKIDARFAQQDEKIDARFAQQKSEIMHEVRLLMEGYFDPKFNHLADGLELLKDKLIGREELDELSDRVDVVEAVVKVHSREIERLKKGDSIA